MSQKETSIRSGLHLHLYRFLHTAAEMLRMHSSSMVYKMLPSGDPDRSVRPNGLMELAKCLREGKVSESRDLRFNSSVEQGANAGAEPECEAYDDQISRVLRSSDPVLVARLRLRARLHLELLRVMNWCFFMLGTTDYERH